MAYKIALAMGLPSDWRETIPSWRRGGQRVSMAGNWRVN